MRASFAAVMLTVLLAGCVDVDDTAVGESPPARSSGFTTEIDEPTPSPETDPQPAPPAPAAPQPQPPAPAPVAPPADPPAAPPAPAPAQPQPQQASEDCDPSYPDFCIAPYPPDLNCADVPGRRFTVLAPDPHGFDRDADGVGCESG